MSANLDERATLVARAKQMGITHHVNLGVDKLKLLVNGMLIEDAPVEPVSKDSKSESRSQYIARRRKEAHRLVRVVVSCRNPEKSESEGDTFTAGNSLIGSTTKYIPFNNEEGWHVPQIILNVLREKKCQVFSWKKTAQGARVKAGKQISEYVITELPPLTPDEIQELKERQAISRSIDE
jgi:hypothetical protein